MANVHGLFSNRGKNNPTNNRDGDGDDDEDDDDANNRYVGGINARGGGSGLAVLPNPNEQQQRSSSTGSSAQRDMVFGLAQEESTGGGVGEGEGSSDEQQQVRRTITMYQNGFIVDDGPYRRLDDPANGEFLRALAMGRTPRELVEGSSSTDGTTNNSNNNIVVGLIDKRSEDYIEPFRSFSGSGETLGSTTTSTDGVFDPNLLPETPSVEGTDTEATPTTSIAVRLPNGKRKVVKIALSATIADLAIQLRDDAESTPFRIMSGFPPQPLVDVTATIEAAGLKGAQISMHKV